MKMFEKLKKGLIGIGIFLLSIPTKVFATMEEMYDLYKPQPLYGVTEPDPLEEIWNIGKIFIIPVALLIGLIIYLKKSKGSKKKKILVTIEIIFIIVIIFFVAYEANQL